MSNIRLQFDVTQDVLERIEIMKEKSRAGTHAEVVRNALKLYEWALQYPDIGNVIEIKNPTGEMIAGGLLLRDILPE